MNGLIKLQANVKEVKGPLLDHVPQSVLRAAACFLYELDDAIRIEKMSSDHLITSKWILNWAGKSSQGQKHSKDFILIWVQICILKIWLSKSQFLWNNADPPSVKI